MVKGKPWTVDEEKQLSELLSQKKSAGVIAAALGKSVDSVLCKIRRLKLVEEEGQNHASSSSNLISGFLIGENGELPNIESALQVLNAAMAQLGTPGLTPDETLRLRSLIQAVKTYKELLTDYLNFCSLEKRMFELEAKYAELDKKTKSPQAS